jgi:hypothetical protein
LLSGAFANPITKSEQDAFIDTWALFAVQEMKRSSIPASITLAQAIVESRWGQSEMALVANNFFGIKCYNGWSGETYMQWDDEETESCFRRYSGPEESFKDHSDFLKANSRYSPLFEHHITDYKSWAKTLKSCGYATAANYADKLIEIIEKHNLAMYDYAMPAAGAVLSPQVPAGLTTVPGLQGQLPETAPSINQATAPANGGELQLPTFNLEAQPAQDAVKPSGNKPQENSPQPGKTSLKAKTYWPKPQHSGKYR